MIARPHARAKARTAFQRRASIHIDPEERIALPMQRSWLVLISLGFLVVGVVLALLTKVVPLNLINAASLVLCIGFVGFLARVRPMAVALMLPMLVMRATELASCFAIERGAYIAEMSMSGGFTGGTARLVAFYIVFILVTTLTIEIGMPRHALGSGATTRAIAPRIMTVLFWITAAVTVAAMSYLFLVGLGTGFPLLTGEDRFSYRSAMSGTGFSAILGNRYIVILILSMFAGQPGKRVAAIGAIMLTLIVSILFGEKFTSLVIMLTTAIIPASIAHVVRHGRLPLGRLFIMVGASAILTLPVILVVYGALDDVGQASSDLADRMSAQGAMWYLADRDFGAFVNWDAHSIVSNLKSWLVVGGEAESAGLSSGLYYVMGQYTSDTDLSLAMEYYVGTIFTFYPYWLIVSGYCGVFVSIIASAIVYGVGCRFILHAIHRRDAILAIVAEKALTFIYGGFFTGISTLVFGLKPVLLLSLSLAVLLLGNWLRERAVAPIVGLLALRRARQAQRRDRMRTST